MEKKEKTMAEAFQEIREQEQIDNAKKFSKGTLVREQRTLGDPDKFEEFKDLLGAKIVDIGFHKKAREGGFAIDYIKQNETITKRIVLGFTELGMWTYWQGKLK